MGDEDEAMPVNVIFNIFLKTCSLVEVYCDASLTRLFKNKTKLSFAVEIDDKCLLATDLSLF